MDEKLADEMRDLIKATEVQHGLTTTGNISPRVYLVGQALLALLPKVPMGEDLSDVAKAAVDIADATLDAMAWPSGKPEGKR